MRILTFQHLSVEHPGTLRDFWRARGWNYQAAELDEGQPIPTLDDFDLLVVMGGPQDVWQEDVYPWLKAEKAAIRRWVLDLGRPYLGICLGHQLLAEALGGRVGSMKKPEVGLTNVEFTSDGLKDPLFSGLGRQMQTFQWHGAEVSELPAGAVTLAKNAACAIQGLRWGKHAYGLQFHVEITPETVAEWEAVPAYKRSLEAALGQKEAAGLTEAVAPRLSAFRSVAHRINDNFLTIIADGFVANSA